VDPYIIHLQSANINLMKCNRSLFTARLNHVSAIHADILRIHFNIGR